MMRIYCPPENILKDKIIVSDPSQIQHMLLVYRLKARDSLQVFDGQESEYECVINSIAKDILELRIKKKSCRLIQNLPKITVACAIPKKAKIDEIIDKLTQLGVDSIIPLHTQRTIVELTPEKAKERLSRWQAIVREASKQSGRVGLPRIQPVSEFKEIISKAQKFDLAIIPYLGPKTKKIKEVVSRQEFKTIIVFIGPEGDFSQVEIELALKNGCVGVSLGDLTLRVDTAAIATVAFLRLNA